MSTIRHVNSLPQMQIVCDVPTGAHSLPSPSSSLPAPLLAASSDNSISRRHTQTVAHPH